MNLESLAALYPGNQTPPTGFSGADIAEVCQRAFKYAIREGIERQRKPKEVMMAAADCAEEPAQIKAAHFEEPWSVLDVDIRYSRR